MSIGWNDLQNKYNTETLLMINKGQDPKDLHELIPKEVCIQYMMTKMEVYVVFLIDMQSIDVQFLFLFLSRKYCRL